MTMRRARRPSPASTTTGILLIAVGAVLAFAAVPVPEQVSRHVSVPAVGLILVWSGVLLLVMKAYLYRPRRPQRSSPYPVDDWYEQDTHRPGEVRGGVTRRLPRR
jgi:hypothetical protein